MKQSLNLKFSQQLTLSPQLKQSLKLLQLPSLDLEQEVQNALDSNPLLERIEHEAHSQEASVNIDTMTTAETSQEISEAADPSIPIDKNDHLAAEQDLSLNWSESFESHHSLPRSTNRNDNSSDLEFTHYAVKQETLFEHLEWQIVMTSISQQDKLVARAIVHCLDHDGYLVAELEEIVEMLSPEIEVEEDEVAAMLSLIKSLEPIGVGARDLSERLGMLLAHINEDRPGLETAKLIVQNHLNLLGSHNLSKLKKALNINDEDLRSALSLITQLNPRIGAQFQTDSDNHIVPDVHVKKVNGVWRASLNPENQLKLRVNTTYSDLLKLDKDASTTLDKAGSDFIQQNLLQAKMFIKGLMSRYDTLLLVSEAIVERQQAFFDNGEKGMQAMILNDIAETLEMHESTISRATAGKYLLCPRGVFELKFFFSSAVGTADGAGSSSTAIRSLIKTMVDTECKSKPLSDSKIAKTLEQQGHIVARRTVAKYRESLHIAPSSQRKSLV